MVPVKCHPEDVRFSPIVPTPTKIISNASGTSQICGIGLALCKEWHIETKHRRLPKSFQQRPYPNANLIIIEYLAPFCTLGQNKKYRSIHMQLWYVTWSIYKTCFRDPSLLPWRRSGCHTGRLGCARFHAFLMWWLTSAAGRSARCCWCRLVYLRDRGAIDFIPLHRVKRLPTPVFLRAASEAFIAF